MNSLWVSRVGQLKCTNPCSSESFSLFLWLNLGKSKELLRCSQWEGSCEGCSKSLKWSRGIFCANFGPSVGTCCPCQSTWCGSCYSSDDSDGFFIATGDTPRSGINDEDRLMSGWVPRKKVDAGRFTVARDEDDLMVSFECDFCFFWKMYNRSPDTGDKRDQL